jgi:hypothetical protein
MSIRKIIIVSCISLLFSQSIVAQKNIIKIDGKKTGRTFEGIGAISGISSRLLTDYPDLYKNQILDILFKPKFGAGIQQLKLEIGGDVNSTDGSVPSHAHTREECFNPQREYFERGYDWMIATEAKKRNPNIIMDCLAWGVPGWIGDGIYYTQDNADYMAAYLKGFKKYHDIDFDYIGIWNEHDYNADWIKLFRQTLNRQGLEKVKIVAADGFGWKIANDALKDKELNDAIYAFGSHYIEKLKVNVNPDPTFNQEIQLNRYYCYNVKNQKTTRSTTTELLSLNKPIRNTEAGPWMGNWNGFDYLAKLFNRSYIEDKITNVIVWNMITCYYDKLPIENAGLMKAKTPWNGYYEVQPAIWALAHTTQFVQPGWRYVDSGCGYLPTGSYVTLVSPDKKDYSIIIETMDTTLTDKVTFQLSEDFPSKPLCLWKSTVEKMEFVRMPDVKIKNGRINLNLDGKSLYTLSTTRGQQKGGFSDIPLQKPFPFPYKTDFETDKIGQAGKYFMDQAGVFEIHKRTDGLGQCLKQVIKQKGIEWQEGVQTTFFTIIGDLEWEDYEVSTDVCLQQNTGTAMIMGRETVATMGKNPPEAYSFKISPVSWILYAGNEVLKTGGAKFEPFKWHNLKMKFAGDEISVSLDNKEIVKVNNKKYKKGRAGLGSDFNYVEFDNFEVK